MYKVVAAALKKNTVATYEQHNDDVTAKIKDDMK